MTGKPAWVRVRALAVCLALSASVAPVAGQAPASVSAAGQAEGFDFDIPAQPLHDALQQYGAITGQSLLYDSTLAAGLVSAPLHGRLGAREALQRLIGATRLRAHYTSPSALMLLPRRPDDAGDGPAVVAPPASAPVSERQAYFALIQARVVAALCADPETAPGDYRVVLRFRIDRRNLLTQLEVHAEGDPALAARVRTQLKGLDLKAAPPAQLQQPVTLLVRPAGGAGC